MSINFIPQYFKFFMALELGAITGKVAQQVVVLAGIFSYVNTVTLRQSVSTLQT
jgi:hypothetical protein